MMVVCATLQSCAEEKNGCDFCGDFNLINFSKNETNKIHVNDVSVSRNLVIDQFNGLDYYTIWSWSDKTPDSSWTERMQKEMKVAESRLTFSQDGTWLWLLNTEERFTASPFYGANNYVVNKEYTEKGSWTYINNKPDLISLERHQASVNNRVVISEKDQPDHIISEFPFTTEQNFKGIEPSRRFAVSTDDTTGEITLKTLEDDEAVHLNGIHDASYSITEGNVLLTLSHQMQVQPLASKLK